MKQYNDSIMKRRMISLLLMSISVVISVLSLLALTNSAPAGVKKPFLDPVTLLAIITSVVAIISIIVAYVTFTQKERTNLIFISYRQERYDEARKVMWKFKGGIFSSVYTIKAGDPIKETLRNEIEKAPLCIVLIDDEVPKSQQYEIKLMKQLKKRIIPVLVSKETAIPPLLDDVKCITLDDFVKG